MRRCARILGIAPLIGALACPVLVLASQAADAAAGDERTIVIEGRDQPQYFVVQGFFRHALLRRDEESPWPYHRLLEHLGIEPGSAAAKRFGQALTEAEAVLAVSTVDATLDGEAFWDYQMRALRAKARSLGHVYATLLRDLGRLGAWDRQVQEYLETTSRRDSRLITKGEWPTEVFEAVESFDLEVQAVLEGGEP